MEWYIKFGERGVIVSSEDVYVDLDLDLDIELMHYGLVEWNDTFDLDNEVFTTKLTPKALELIKGNT